MILKVNENVIMDIIIETNFIKKCVKKEYQERLIFEILSKKHREKAIYKFAHNAHCILNKTCKKISLDDLRCSLSKFDNNVECYLILNSTNEGTIIPLQRAFKLLLDSRLCAILIIDNTIIIKEECEGTPTFYLSL